ncbi:alpha/beta fold hydrolase [Kushneria indalinina]|uniref:Pimeloyl-[acyl-carrier protein] methyl ester esterase n=1 Tax=Kushneria indalinina DSM 14324 TaxID=1122140 RepID=A0A3D9DYN8_9GAMM|nr:alpha/beta hydrolase [Kushneria indalinina]REC95821.1 pimeloyl-[acyl-carrier protein] methyl ester esterase [Kushneria indalinina DSM 14324]
MSTFDKTTLVLLPGWVLGPRPLAPLARAIERLDPRISVQCPVYPRLKEARLETWLEALDAQLPDNAWLGGWSMGGMLATALAERRGARTPGLITMGASARVMPPAWSEMSVRPRALGSWLDQGRHDVWHLGKRLLATLPRAGARQSATELALLGSMDLRQTLGRLTIPQLHLFGEHDMLIPWPARQAMAECLPPTGQIQMITDAGHGLVIDRTDDTAQAIVAFLNASSRSA